MHFIFYGNCQIYFIFFQDSLIENTADIVNLTAAMASSTLSGRPKERIINPTLRHSIQPPWGELDVKDWAKT